MEAARALTLASWRSSRDRRSCRYCPLAVYVGRLGYCLELALRLGVPHLARESEYNLERTLPLTASLVTGPLQVRADSGFCSVKLMQEISAQGAAHRRKMDFIIKWNPRKTRVETVAAGKVADTGTAWQTLRPGKRECV